MNITYLLQNAYNAPWPKSFNATAFTTPDMESIQDSKEIANLPGDIQLKMGKALVEENLDLKFTPFWDTFMTGIELITNDIKQ